MIGDSYVHDLASGEVAAAYRTSLNSGDTRADLTGVYREITVMLLPMTERASGRVGRMPPQIDVVVPAQARSLSRLGACTGC